MNEMKNKKVFVAGCGGLGGFLVEMLVRLGVGEVRVADGDVFSPSNMNRQLYCLPSTLGKSKVVEAKLRWPETVEAFNRFLDEENVSYLINGCDLVVDALDNVASRRILATACADAGIPLVHGAIGERNMQVCAIFPEDADILDILYPASSSLKKYPTFSYVPACCASLQSAIADRILHGDFSDRRKLYLADLSNFELETVVL